MIELAGARIALLEARLASELAELVRRSGGEPVCAPAVVEARLDVSARISVLVDVMHRGGCEIFVSLTGAGLTALLEQADEVGLRGALIEALTSVMTVCRGPKPAAVLRRHGVPVSTSARTPFTTAELLELLPADLVRGKGVTLLHDGGGNPSLAAELRARGARVTELRTYEWRLPDDLTPLEQLVHELMDGRVNAVAFTSQVQARHLVEVAARMNSRDALLDALRRRTVVASIGPTCSQVLVELGAPPHVVASPPKMRPLVAAIASHLMLGHAHTSTRITT
jgi:uroporphyrinogen-III synthase